MTKFNYMKNMLAVLCTLIALGAVAQDIKSKAINELAKLTERYQSKASLAFDVTYNYSMLSDPGKIMESLSGRCMIKGRKCDYTIDKTRTVFDGKLLAAVYDDDSLIYLSRPGMSDLNINPVKMLDNLFASTDVKYSVEEKEDKLTITIDFLKDANCKQIMYEIDRKSGLLSRMIQIVSSNLMYESAQESPVGEESSYSKVETLLNHYSTGELSDQRFDINNYVKKEGDQYIAVGEYRNYKIFIATPNL